MLNQVSDEATILDNRLLARLQAKSSRDDQVVRLAQSWIEECEQNHADCKSKIGLKRPSRLLKITTDPPDHLKVRLVDGAQNNDSYVALSYCWGPPGDQFIVLSRGTETHLREGMSAADLPATLRDAANTTQKLGYDCLWIDALCIKQDDKDDWAQEAARMRDVYRGAVVTIEAASAESSSEGFLKDRKSSMPYCKLAWIKNTPRTYVDLRPIQDISDSQLYGTRLYTRGWTLQERLLARRTLSFGTQQITFECISGHRQEVSLRQQPLSRTKGHLLSKAVLRSLDTEDQWYYRVLRYLLNSLGITHSFKLFEITWVVGSARRMDLSETYSPVQTYSEIWADLVHLYSQRSLTKNSDRLPAISGLAEEFSRRIDDTYVAGMWEKDLVVWLGWDSSLLYRSEEMKKTTVASLYVEEEYLVGDWPYSVQNDDCSSTPSWSWASVRGPVKIPTRGPMTEDLATILDLSDGTDQNNCDGQLGSPSIKIRAPFLSIPDPRLESSILENCPYPDLLAKIRWHVRSTYAWACEFYQQHRHHEGQEFALLKLFRYKIEYAKAGMPLIQLLLIESCPDGSFRRLLSKSEHAPSSENEFITWHRRYEFQVDDRDSYDVRMRLSNEEYVKKYGDDVQKGLALGRDLVSPLWQMRDVRLV